ncbi:hypothetical protein [Achromobacter denitrificans]|uniref:Uncharacterized protein n=1 Tax=Achromobacter denitrificans TaxID=32002 RepID=A0ABZ3GE18_ACHDE
MLFSLLLTGCEVLVNPYLGCWENYEPINGCCQPIFGLMPTKKKRHRRLIGLAHHGVDLDLTIVETAFMKTSSGFFRQCSSSHVTILLGTHTIGSGNLLSALRWKLTALTNPYAHSINIDEPECQVPFESVLPMNGRSSFVDWMKSPQDLYPWPITCAVLPNPSS